jgi:hypothetical protein
MESHTIENKLFQKMNFVMNAVEQGWTVKKIDEQYIFTKKHEGKREVFKADYLETFLRGNLRFPLTPSLPGAGD